MNLILNGKKIFIISTIIIISLEPAISLLNFTYPSAISLTNNNVLIVEMNGIYVYDEHLKNIIYSYPFEETEKITSTSILSNMIIKFEFNNIICLINQKIFLFDNKGIFLMKTGILINERIYYHPSLTPIPIIESNSYYYVISYFIYENSSYKQRVLYNKINLLYEINSLLGALTLDKFESKAFAGLSTDTYDFQAKGLSCEFMQCENDDSYNYLVYFLTIIKSDDNVALILNYFKLT